MRRGTILFFLFILVLGAAAIYIANPSTPGIHIGGYNNNLAVKQGLDLQGGIQIVMKAHCPQDQPKCTISQDDMTAVIANLNRRISQGLAVNEAVVRQEGNDRVLIELPGLKDDQQALALLGKTGQMNIIDTGGNYVAPNTNVANQTCTTNCKTGQYKVVFTGSQLNTNQISATIDQQTGKPIVTFAFAGSAQKAFADYTRNNIGKYLTITLDNVVIESAVIQNEIAGNGQITGIPDVGQAQNLATLLKYGALRVPLSVESEQQLAPTLGAQALDFSKRAAIIGLGMVALFMLIYYRFPGLLADVALMLYALLLFSVIKLMGVTLSLPGIAALILTVGMAVDANVLIFERMKEELRSGRTMAAAVDIGFKRAWPSIRDSNASTMITCLILYWFGNNFGATIIVGFAVNLFVGVAISLFTAVVVTRNFLNLLVPTGIATHPALYGLSQSALNVPRYRRAQPATSSRTSRSVLVPANVSQAGEEGDGASDDSESSNGHVPAEDATSKAEE